ncbi:MAG: hypothetical protein AAGA37_10460 [Actinomycetota bacterium]
MSMEVPLEGLYGVAASLGSTAYAVVAAADGAPRITHVRPAFAGETITFELGRRSIECARQTGHLSLLWPATTEERMSLIVDAEVRDVVEDRHIVVTPTGAVRHRPAPLDE